MAGHSRPKDGVASLAYVPAIHALLCSQGVDARHKAGHDVEGLAQTNRKQRYPFLPSSRIVFNPMPVDSKPPSTASVWPVM
jgi:hypothetical protein